MIAEVATVTAALTTTTVTAAAAVGAGVGAAARRLPPAAEEAEAVEVVDMLREAGAASLRVAADRGVAAGRVQFLLR